MKIYIVQSWKSTTQINEKHYAYCLLSKLSKDTLGPLSYWNDKIFSSSNILLRLQSSNSPEKHYSRLSFI